MESTGEKKRKQYTKEFKLEAVRITLEQDRSVASVVRDLGISQNALYKWKRQYQADGKSSFPGHGKLKPEDEELRRLKRELQIVTAERDILKKTIGYFAKDEK
jgi:transposase